MAYAASLDVARLCAATLSHHMLITIVDYSDHSSPEIVCCYDRGIVREIGERW